MRQRTVAVVMNGQEHLSLPVTEVMTIPATVVGVDVPLHEALTGMQSAGVRNSAAIDSAGRCVGVLSDGWLLDCLPGDHRTVAAALTAEPPVIPTGLMVGEAAEIMKRSGLDVVAVVDPKGRPVGLLTAEDLAVLG